MRITLVTILNKNVTLTVKANIDSFRLQSTDKMLYPLTIDINNDWYQHNFIINKYTDLLHLFLFSRSYYVYVRDCLLRFIFYFF